MFNLDNFDLDIDDDFSSNIFSKRISLGLNNKVEKDRPWKKSHVSVESTSDQKINESSCKKLQPDSKAETTSNFLDFCFDKNSKENSLKRSSIQDEKPQKKRLSDDGLLQRKFPGPAGLLPDKPFKEISDLDIVTKKVVEEDETETKSSYQKLVSDFNLNESENPLNKYTIDWVKRTALSKGFQRRKIPFLGLVVHSVKQGLADSVLVLKDQTGEIYGSLHKEVWTDMGGKLRPGVALALRQIGVLITGVIRRQIYLNITLNNILSLYSPSDNEHKVEITTVNKASRVELIKSFEEWLAQPPNNIPANPNLDSPLFTTVNDLPLFSNNKGKINTSRKELDVSKERKNNTRERNTDEVLANLGITLTDNDFQDEIDIPEMNSSDIFESEKESVCKRTSTQVLSQAESLIFEEVLSGIDLDEFET